MIPRRGIMAISLALVGAGATSGVAWGQGDPAAAARAFVQQAGNDLAASVNGGQPASQKRAELQRIVDRVIDVDGFGRFCLGRFWASATPSQQQQYLQLFHAVLMNNVTNKISQYAGVSFSMGRAAPQGDAILVDTTVTWPNYAPYNVKWLVNMAGPSPKVIDVVAQGTSLRLTQRNDYAGYLAQNNANMDALITAMRGQVGG